MGKVKTNYAEMPNNTIRSHPNKENIPVNPLNKLSFQAIKKK